MKDYIGIRINNYEITQLIGEGGMANVFLAKHTRLETQKVAIKILKPEFAYKEIIRKRFLREANIMANLQHPNITRVLDFEENENILAIVLEYLEGDTLSNYLYKNGAVTNIDILKKLFNQVFSAFAYAHNQKEPIVHRDVKPSNIFVLPDNTIKILDFGIAKLISQDDFTQTGTHLGTPAYMSPEQVMESKNVDKRSDIYSLGVTLFVTLAGKPLYDKTKLSAFDIQNKIVHEALPKIPLSPNMGYLNDIIKKATQKKPEDRYQNIDEMQQALMQVNPSAPINNTLDDETKLSPSSSVAPNISFKEEGTLVDVPLNRKIVEPKPPQPSQPAHSIYQNKEKIPATNAAAKKNEFGIFKILAGIFIGLIFIWNVVPQLFFIGLLSSGIYIIWRISNRKVIFIGLFVLVVILLFLLYLRDGGIGLLDLFNPQSTHTEQNDENSFESESNTSPTQLYGTFSCYNYYGNGVTEYLTVGDGSVYYSSTRLGNNGYYSHVVVNQQSGNYLNYSATFPNLNNQTYRIEIRDNQLICTHPNGAQQYYTR